GQRRRTACRCLMNRRNHYLLAAAIFATACVGNERHHDRIVRSWPADGIRRISLREIDGSVDVAAGPANEISLIADVRERGVEASGNQEVTAHTVNGRVKARFLNAFQGASLKTVNGSVDAVLPKSASFACDLSQINGDFEASFPLSIHSHPGSRRVSGEVNGGRYSLRITTVNGDIKIDTVAAPPAPVVPETPAAPTAAPAQPAPRT